MRHANELSRATAQVNETRARIERLEQRTLLAFGGTDSSFDSDGRASIDFSVPGTKIVGTSFDVAVQSDGKTVAVGKADIFRSGKIDDTLFAIARFNIDGSLDTSFGPAHNGRVTLQMGDKFHSVARAVAIQSDGKILVAGSTSVQRTLARDGDDFAIARLNPDGSLDNTFGTRGKRTINLRLDSEVYSIAIQPDGRIVLGGESADDGIIFDSLYDFAVVRLKRDGSLDNSFDGDGKRIIERGRVEGITKVAIDNSTGDILLRGWQYTINDPSRYVLTRLHGRDGSIDKSFGNGGTVFGTIPGYSKIDDPIFNTGHVGMFIQPDSKIIVVGDAAAGNNHDIFIARHNVDGSLDKSFGTGSNGITTIDFGGSDRGSEIIPSFGGGFIVTGLTRQNFALLGLTSTGSIDTRFGTGGKAITTFGSDLGTTFNLSMAKGPGHRFVLSGGERFKTVRYLDIGATVVSVRPFTVPPFDNTATEGTTDTASFIVSRSENLTTPTRVYFAVGGTAVPQGTLGNSIFDFDYSVSGLTFPSPFATDRRPFVDIPANRSSTVVTITAKNDNAVEGIENASFTITTDPSYDLGVRSTEILIADATASTTTQLSGANDAYVRDGSSADTNFGSAADLQVKTGSSGSNRLTYIKFDLSNLNNITSAKLNLFGAVSDTQNSSVAVSVFPVADNSWSGSGITFNNKPAPGATAITTVNIVGTAQTLYQFDVTNYVKQEKSLGHNLVSFQLRAPNSSSSFVSFVSANAGGSKVPKLAVTSAASGVGTFTIDAPTTVRARQKLTVDVNWTVPSGGWRQLDWVKLVLRDMDDANSFAVIKYDEAQHDRFYRVTPAGNSVSPIGLDLADCKIIAAGPTSSKVTIRFAFHFNASAAGHRFIMETTARNDAGQRDGFSSAGNIAVKEA